jgi:transcriptional regulator with XRE-family HTH domain
MNGMLGDLLADEFSTPEEMLALELAREDQLLLSNLIEVRRKAGLSQQDVADALGLSQASISAFERVGNDPHLSTIRRYARVVGAMVRHLVEEEEGRGCGSSEYIAHMSSDGLSVAATAAAIQRSSRSSLPEWPEDLDEIDPADLPLELAR